LQSLSKKAESKSKNMKKLLLNIFSLLDSEKRKLPYLLFLFLVMSLFDVISIGIIGPYLAYVVSPEPTPEWVDWIASLFSVEYKRNELLIVIGMLLLSVFLLKTLISIYVQKEILNFSQKQQVRLRLGLLKQISSMPYIEFVQRNSAEYIHNLQQLTQNFVNSLRMLLRSISDVFVVFALLIMLSWIYLEVVIILFVVVVIVASLFYLLIKNKQTYHGLMVNSSSQKMIQYLQEFLYGFKELRVLNKEHTYVNAYTKQAVNYGKNHSQSLLIISSIRYIMEITMVFVVIVVTILANQNHSGDLISMLAVLGLSAVRILPAGNLVLTVINQMRYDKDAIARLHDNYYKFSDMHKEDVSDDMRDIEEFEELSFNNVSFSYKQNLIINNASFVIKKNQVIGFVGESGSGKTTLLDLIMGLLSPTDGNIKFNKINLQQYISKWNSIISYMPQEGLLMDATLAANIALEYDADNIDINLIQESIDFAQLNKFVDSSALGMNALIGEHGSAVSGGQRQRILLARTFYNKRNVLVMDEATRGLDEKTEHEVVEEIKRLKGSRTIIIVAHKISTLRFCDLIYEVKEGNVLKGVTYADFITSHKH